MRVPQRPGSRNRLSPHHGVVKVGRANLASGRRDVPGVSLTSTARFPGSPIPPGDVPGISPTSTRNPPPGTRRALGPSAVPLVTRPFRRRPQPARAASEMAASLPRPFARPFPPGRQPAGPPTPNLAYSRLVKVRATTRVAPALRRAAAQDVSVAPVVRTSSTRSTLRGAAATASIRGGWRMRSARPRPR